MHRLQTQAGHTHEEWQEVGQAILNLAKDIPTNNNPRDTQFAGFARLLLEDLKPDLAMLFTELSMNYPSRKEAGIQEAETIIKQHIAQRAYDLVTHVIETADYRGIDGWIKGVNIPLFHKVVQSIPDMTAWPEEAK